MSAPPRTILRVLLVNGALLLAGVLVLELVFGHWRASERVSNPLLIRNVVLRYELSDLYRTHGTHARYTRDAHGLRGAYRSPAEIDILTVGGSTTDQRFVDDTLTYQARLAERFHTAGREVSVVNAGVDGQTTYGHLRSFDVWFAHIPGFAPKYYLYYVGLNDLHVPADYGAGPLLGYDDFDGQSLGALRELIVARSALYGLFAVARGLLWTFDAKAQHGARRLEGLAYVARPEPLTPLDAEEQAKVRGYRLRLERLFTRTHEVSPQAGLICVTQPGYGIWRRDAGGQVWVADMPQYRLLEAFNAALLEVCAAHHGLGLDLAHELDLQASDFYDVVHTTASGSQKLGDYLYTRLATLEIPAPPAHHATAPGG